MASAPKKSTEKKAAADAELHPKKNKKLLIIIILIILIAISCGAGWYFYSKDKPHVEKEAVISAPIFVSLEPLTVNLTKGDDGSDSYLQIAMTAQVGENEHAEMLKQYMPQVRSRLLSLLSSKKSAEIASPDGKKKLVDEILEKIRQPYSKGGASQRIMNVFFTSFVVQ
jgi:flagellar FliL protein